ncbi:MAG: ATP-binding cassette domain-containing protein [Bacteroidota bacterium]|nr:ATP-binding cassette domain-containing protein [Bacteroidota bacterium]
MDFFVAENISKEFINHKALSDVSINVPEQSIFGLLGPNGAGKTTLIRIINHITAPDKGRLFFNGEKLSPKHISQIGYLPEERGLYKKMKVGEQAMYLAQLKGVSKNDARKRLKIWFEKFGIENWWDKKVEELSKGMQQKVQFIVTIIHKPKLLIFDEPFSGFDPINTNLLKEEILTLKENGATVLFSTHNMGSVEELCDHIALINNSKKILEGKVKEIKKTYSTNSFSVELLNSKGNIAKELNTNYELLKESIDEEVHQFDIQIKNGTSPNDLISNLTNVGTIQSFKEIIPSMNDIFITTVQNNK